jgi:hypothetical protein
MAIDCPFRECKGVRNLSPEQEACSIGPIHESWIFHFLMDARAVEAKFVNQFDFTLEGIRRGGRQLAFGPVALVEDEPQEDRLAIYQELPVSKLNRA